MLAARTAPAPFIPVELIEEVEALGLQVAFATVQRDEQTAYANWLRSWGGMAPTDVWEPLSAEQLLQRTRARGVMLTLARAA